MEKNNPLAEDILGLLLRANEENELDVAEHLLKALEILAQREEAEEEVREIYRQLLVSAKKE
jgi:hypothetical protein